MIKAQLISSNSVQTGEDYVFTTTNDDLEKFTGRSAQFTFSNIVLRSILNQLPPSEYSRWSLKYMLYCLLS